MHRIRSNLRSHVHRCVVVVVVMCECMCERMRKKVESFTRALASCHDSAHFLGFCFRFLIIFTTTIAQQIGLAPLVVTHGLHES